MSKTALSADKCVSKISRVGSECVSEVYRVRSRVEIVRTAVNGCNKYGSASLKGVLSHCSLTIQSLFTHYTVIVHSRHCSLTIQPLFTHYTVIVHSLYSHCSLTIQPLFTHYTVIVHSLYSHCSLTIQSLFTHYTVIAVNGCNKYGSASLQGVLSLCLWGLWGRGGYITCDISSGSVL